MSDLISRSDVLKLPRYNFGTSVSMLTLEEYIKVSDIKKILTAYSVDKVVEKLKKESFHVFSDFPIMVELDEAIEIVKQGSVSDDTDNVCEWKKYPFNWFAGCDGCEVNHKQGDYCPRCGKKIKVKQNDN